MLTTKQEVFDLKVLNKFYQIGKYCLANDGKNKLLIDLPIPAALSDILQNNFLTECERLRQYNLEPDTQVWRLLSRDVPPQLAGNPGKSDPQIPYRTGRCATLVVEWRKSVR